jgi:hypothetical protein
MGSTVAEECTGSTNGHLVAFRLSAHIPACSDA